MTLIWKNFFTGRNPVVLMLTVTLFALVVIRTFNQPFAWFFGPLALLGILFGLPSAVFLIDQDKKKNPNRPTSPKNLILTLRGK
jgi:prepilin signal peptidase PulO-like enzyme (type II secretory pathway)